ncbi:hypothetical protein TWF281_003030 [Arthrobotrys megalospora]
MATNHKINPISSSAATGGQKNEQDVLLAQIHALSSAVDRASKRVDSDHQALMSSISIVESERAIAEAEVVSKLTQLAFFFIPLSLVAAVFGMNINEFEGRLTWWHWLVLSLSASFFTYALLYRAEIFANLRHFPSLVRGLSIRSLSKLAFQWLRILEFVLGNLPTTLVALSLIFILVGEAVVVWKIAVSSILSAPAKAAVASAIFTLSAPPFPIWLPVPSGTWPVYRIFVAYFCIIILLAGAIGTWEIATLSTISTTDKAVVSSLQKESYF